MAFRARRTISREYVRPRFRRQKRSNPLRDWLIAAIVLFTLMAALALAAGLVRYGGTEGLIRRVRIEAARYRSHPEFVPTPLAASADTALLDASHEPAGEAAGETPVAQPTPTPTPAYDPPQAEVMLGGLSHWWQTWNNCGPATLAMNLSYYGSDLDQTQVGDALRPNKDDKNVSPHEMAAYAGAQGYRALSLVNGDIERLRLLVSNGIPVLVETWHVAGPNDGMGHYRLLIGYSDAKQEWIAYDSFIRPEGDGNQPYNGVRAAYDGFDDLWAVFNRAYVLVYTDELAPLVHSILGEDVDESLRWRNALADAEAERQAEPDDPFALFNLGTDLVALGEVERAAIAYDRARVIGLPWRMLWYQFGPFEAYYETYRYNEVIALADATIASGGDVEEVYYWRGKGLAALQETDRARQAWQRALKMNPNYEAARIALADTGAE